MSKHLVSKKQQYFEALALIFLSVLGFTATVVVLLGGFAFAKWVL